MSNQPESEEINSKNPTKLQDEFPISETGTTKKAEPKAIPKPAESNPSGLSTQKHSGGLFGSISSNSSLFSSSSLFSGTFVKKAGDSRGGGSLFSNLHTNLFKAKETESNPFAKLASTTVNVPDFLASKGTSSLNKLNNDNTNPDDDDCFNNNNNTPSQQKQIYLNIKSRPVNKSPYQKILNVIFCLFLVISFLYVCLFVCLFLFFLLVFVLCVLYVFFFGLLYL